VLPSSSVQALLLFTTADWTSSSARARFRGATQGSVDDADDDVEATGAVMEVEGAMEEEAEEGTGGGGGTNLVAATLAAKVDLSSVGRAANSEDDVFCLERAMLRKRKGGVERWEGEGEGRKRKAREFRHGSRESTLALNHQHLAIEIVGYRAHEVLSVTSYHQSTNQAQDSASLTTGFPLDLSPQPPPTPSSSARPDRYGHSLRPGMLDMSSR